MEGHVKKSLPVPAKNNLDFSTSENFYSFAKSGIFSADRTAHGAFWHSLEFSAGHLHEWQEKCFAEILEQVDFD